MGTAMKQLRSHSPVRASKALLRPQMVGVASICTVLAAACGPSTQDKFDDFLDDTKEQREEAQQTRDVGGALVDISGTFLFAIAPSLSPTTPLQFIATNTMEIEADGSSGTFDMVLQPLSLNVGSTTEPREPVGNTIEIRGIMVDGGGVFVVETLGGPVMVTGEANPITGSDIVAEISLLGAIQDEDVYCGTAGGQVTSPLVADLAGSTFGAQRIEDTAAASLPPPLTECPEGTGPAPGDTDGDTDQDEA